MLQMDGFELKPAVFFIWIDNVLWIEFTAINRMLITLLAIQESDETSSAEKVPRSSFMVTPT
jgi:hypothetical protein